VSLDRLIEHRRLWDEKPALARVYGVWFDRVLTALPPGGRVLEVGAGPGFFARHAARVRPDLRWIASDLLAAPWNRLVADALQLPIRSGSVDAVVGIDFIHHLARPARFFREAARVLVPAGHIVAIEPWITMLSYPVYRFLHHERCRTALDPWDAFPDAEAKDAFDGDSALPWALVRRSQTETWRHLGLEPPRVRLLNGFAYLLSLGFKSGCLLPAGVAGLILSLDEATRPIAPLSALRAELWWSTSPGAAAGD
jgi:SAM-dependent methyltransferase